MNKYLSFLKKIKNKIYICLYMYMYIWYIKLIILFIGWSSVNRHPIIQVGQLCINCFFVIIMTYCIYSHLNKKKKCRNTFTSATICINNSICWHNIEYIRRIWQWGDRQLNHKIQKTSRVVRRKNKIVSSPLPIITEGNLKFKYLWIAKKEHNHWSINHQF